MLLKEVVGGSVLNSHGNYIADRGNSWKNHGIVFLNFCGNSSMSSDFIWDFRMLPFLSHLGEYIIKIGKISVKIYEIGKIKAIFFIGNDSHIRPKKWPNKITDEICIPATSCQHAYVLLS